MLLKPIRWWAKQLAWMQTWDTTSKGQPQRWRGTNMADLPPVPFPPEPPAIIPQQPSMPPPSHILPKALLPQATPICGLWATPITPPAASIQGTASSATPIAASTQGTASSCSSATPIAASTVGTSSLGAHSPAQVAEQEARRQDLLARMQELHYLQSEIAQQQAAHAAA
jgi:hypothetical protein